MENSHFNAIMSLKRNGVRFLSHLSKILLYLLSIPKTVWFNFKYLKPKDALKFPFLVSKNVYLMDLRGSVNIEVDDLSFGMIKIGFGQVGIFDQNKSRSIWQVRGLVTFNGKANIGHGSKISVNGELELGEGFAITAESSIVCNHSITFGKNALISWENLFMDTDYHAIYNNENQLINPDKPIVFGDNLWVGARCTILKGTSIGNDVIIASNSVISGNHLKHDNVVIGGNPAKVIKEDVSRYKRELAVS